MGSTKFVAEARSPAEMKKFQTVVDLFRKYAGQYNVDFLLMMAQGYQESRLDQQVKSPVGAIGVMQVMPATGKELAVGDVKQLEPNIHAGVKYMRFMIDRYYKDEPMDALNKGLFTFASYNAGPARIRQLRQEAGAARPQPERLVQQRRDRRVGEDWARNGDLRRQHLQVLRRVQVGGRGHGAGQEKVASVTSGRMAGIRLRVRPCAAGAHWQ